MSIVYHAWLAECYTLIMTGRTHDLFAFTALSCILATQPIPKMSLATGLVALCACFIGGLAPDIDQPTADLWGRLPAGNVISRVFTPFFRRSSLDFSLAHWSGAICNYYKSTS